MGLDRDLMGFKRILIGTELDFMRLTLQQAKIPMENGPFSLMWYPQQSHVDILGILPARMRDRHE